MKLQILTLLTGAILANKFNAYGLQPVQRYKLLYKEHKKTFTKKNMGSLKAMYQGERRIKR